MDIHLSLAQEITLMREILSSYLAEERSILERNYLAWQEIMQRRFFLMEGIKACRSSRDPNDRLADEFSYLVDQFFCLATKISQQCKKNIALDQMTELAMRNGMRYVGEKKQVRLMTTVLEEL